MRVARERFTASISANAKLPVPDQHALGELSREMVKEERKRFAAYTGDARDEVDNSDSTPCDILKYRINQNPNWEPRGRLANKKEE
jgi:hypothetical protein